MAAGRNNYENNLVGRLTNEHESSLLATHAQLCGIPREDIDFWVHSLLSDSACLEAIFPGYSSNKITQLTASAKINNHHIKSIQKWFLIMKQKHGYVSHRFKIKESIRNDLHISDKHSVVFNQIIEIMTASVIQALLDGANNSGVLGRNIQVYKTSLADDMTAGIDYIIEIDGQCIGVDLTMANSQQYIDKKKERKITIAEEYQMVRQQWRVKAGKMPYRSIRLPRKVLVIDKKRVFAIMSEYMESVTELNGHMNNVAINSAINTGLEQVSTMNSKNAIQHFRNQILQLIAS